MLRTTSPNLFEHKRPLLCCFSVKLQGFQKHHNPVFSDKQRRTCLQEWELSPARAACHGWPAARRCRTPWWRSGRRPCTARGGWSRWRPARWPSLSTLWPSRAVGCWQSLPFQAGRAVGLRQRLAAKKATFFLWSFLQNKKNMSSPRETSVSLVQRQPSCWPYNRK